MTSNLGTLELQPGAAPVTIEGEVQTRKFESILIDEIYTRKEGQGMLRAAVVGFLAIPLIPLVAIYDLIRYGLFKYGKCDGKSWSLIDKASEAVGGLAAKVNSAVVEKKELTPEEVNAKSEQTMKKNVEGVVKGYLKLQGGLFGRLFDSNTAIEGEDQIEREQNNLVTEIVQYLDRNVARSEDYPAHLDGVKTYVRGLFVEAAKNKRYYESKVERKGPRPLLSVVAMKEFEDVLAAHEKVATSFLVFVDRDYVADQTKTPAEAIQNLVQNLKVGVQGEVITQEQANAKVEWHAKNIYNQAIATGGPKEAATALKDLLEAGLRAELFGMDGATQIYNNVQFTPVELATAVVGNVVQFKKQNPAAKPAALDQKIVNAAQELKEQMKLDPRDEAEFLNEAKAQLNAVQATLESEAQAQLALQAEQEAAAAVKAKEEAQAAAALQERQAAEAAEAALRTEAMQKIAAERQNLFDVLKNFLTGISEKQIELLKRYGVYEAQAAQKAEMVGAINQILQMKVLVGKDKKEMTVLQAYEYRSKKVAEINASNRTPDEQMTKLVQFEQDFGADAVAVIAQLHLGEEAVTAQTMAMSETLKSIDALDLEIGVDIASYKKFAKPEIKKLDGEQKQQIKALQGKINDVQNDLNSRYRKVHHLSSFGNLPSEKAEPVEINVNDYLDKLVVAEPSMTSKLWNGFTAPFNYLARAVGAAG